MKKFIYTRLFGQGYSFHVPPAAGQFDKILELATDESTRADGKGLILLSEKGRTIIAVRKELSLKDKFGRNRHNLIGFQLEPGEPIPFFDAVKSRLGAIDAEVLAAHAKLDEDPMAGKSLQHTDILFDRGNYTAGNGWDEAVKAINASPETPRLFIGDVHGAGKEYPPEPKDFRRNETKKTPEATHATTPGVNGAEAGTAGEAVSAAERSFVGKLLHERPVVAGGVAAAAVAAAGVGYWALRKHKEEDTAQKPASAER